MNDTVKTESHTKTIDHSLLPGHPHNIYHAITQMPKGSLTFMSGMHSYWYMPGQTSENE